MGSSHSKSGGKKNETNDCSVPGHTHTPFCFAENTGGLRSHPPTHVDDLDGSAHPIPDRHSYATTPLSPTTPTVPEISPIASATPEIYFSVHELEGHCNVSRPPPQRRLRHLSELIDPADLPMNSHVRSPSGNVLAAEEYLAHPNRPKSLRERREEILRKVRAVGQSAGAGLGEGVTAAANGVSTAQVENVRPTVATQRDGERAKAKVTKQKTNGGKGTNLKISPLGSSNTARPEVMDRGLSPSSNGDMAANSAIKGGWNAPADNTKSLPFECTYSTCVRRFATLKEMKYHKLDDPDHYYCKRCDVDCEDWEALTTHKVDMMSPWLEGGPMQGNREVTPKHVVCEFCGIEYKTFGAVRAHREQSHRAEQHIVCPKKECKKIFGSASAFIQHLEDGHCEGMTPAGFWALLEQQHVNKQIMKDTTILDRLQKSTAAAELSDGVGCEDTDTEYGGMALSATPSIIDAEDGADLQSQYRALRPKQDLVSLLESRSPSTIGSRVDWPACSIPLTGSMNSMSISSYAPSVNGTELSASEYAQQISNPRMPPTIRGGGRYYADFFPSLRSPSYAPSVAGAPGSDATTGVRTIRTPSAWTTISTSQALFPDARSKIFVEPDDGSWNDGIKDIRQVRWWDPDHEEFQPQFFHSKDLMESRTYGCPFADCEDTYGYDNIDVLKAHLRHAHLKIDVHCPACKKRFLKPSAFVAHAESHGKCKVEGAPYYQRTLDHMSGGFLEGKRLPMPRIYRQNSAVVLANGTRANGVMQTQYQATLPRQR